MPGLKNTSASCDLDLTFELLTLKLIVSCPCRVDCLCQFAAKSVHSLSKYRLYNVAAAGRLVVVCDDVIAVSRVEIN